MARSNEEVARALGELADLLELRGEDRFRILSYRRAAEVVEGLGADVGSLSEAELRGLRGIGRGVAAKIREYLDQGRIETLEKLRAEVPPSVTELTGLPGLGPKRAMLLYREFGIASLDDLRAALEGDTLSTLRGFGERSVEALRRALADHRPMEAGGERRVLIWRALHLADALLDELRGNPAVVRCAYAGSLRRMRETIGDLDLLASSDRPDEVMEAFRASSQVVRVLGSGGTKTSAVTSEGIQVDLRVVPDDSFGAAMQYFTGSKAHNVKVREHAVRRGLKLSEYGLFRVEDDARIAGATEEDVYAALGMPWIPPTMREDRGEVEAALAGELPAVVTREDLRGDLQSHSTYSDGKTSIREMALAAAALGYEYYAITDHGRKLGMRGLSLEDIERQRAEVAELNRELAGRITVLHGVELNVGLEGDLDYPDEVLATFDMCVASVHSHLDRGGETMTRRLLRAIDNPHVHVIGHPTGRRIGKRPGADFDVAAVAKAAAAHGVALEINASPERLDLRDEHVRWAREQGVRFAISTDAHNPRELDNIGFAVGTAQRGWATAEETITTWPLPRLRRFLAKQEL